MPDSFSFRFVPFIGLCLFFTVKTFCMQTALRQLCTFVCVSVRHLNGSGAIFDDERVKETEAITGVTALIADELPQFMRHLLEIPGRCKNKCDTY